MPGAWRSLALLVLVALYTYADRQLFALQAESIRSTFGIGDAQFGLLQGTSVALFTAVAGYPLGWLADRVDRRWVLGLCLSGWSLSMAWCARSTSFPELFVASACIGVAEAGLIPLAYALIPEWFEGRSRQTANSTYVFLGRMSIGLVIFACGVLIGMLEQVRPLLRSPLDTWPVWRLSMMLVALPGLLMLPLLVWMPRTRPRGTLTIAPSVPRLAPWLRTHAASFGTMCVAFGLLTLGASAVAAFVPALAARAWQVTSMAAGQGLGAAALAGSAVAMLASTLLTRSASTDHRETRAIQVAAAALALGALANLLLPLASTARALYLLCAPSLMGVMTAAMLFPGVVQALTPKAMRARLMALFVATSTLGAAAGPLLAGMLSDAHGGTAEALAMAMATVGSGSLAIASLMLAMASRRGLLHIVPM